MEKRKKLGIFTKPIHVEKIVNYLNQSTTLDYVVSTDKQEVSGLDFEVGISYCFPYIVKVGDSPDSPMWYNYHPAPLPKYPGLSNYAAPVRDKVIDFGVSLHIMTNEVDDGPILEVEKFALNSAPVNSNELGTISHYYLFQLFKKTINALSHAPKNKEQFDAAMALKE